MTDSNSNKELKSIGRPQTGTKTLGNEEYIRFPKPAARMITDVLEVFLVEGMRHRMTYFPHFFCCFLCSTSEFLTIQKPLILDRYCQSNKIFILN
jgi:hypothetical protein